MYKYCTILRIDPKCIISTMENSACRRVGSQISIVQKRLHKNISVLNLLLVTIITNSKDRWTNVHLSMNGHVDGIHFLLRKLAIKNMKFCIVFEETSFVKR